MDAIEYGLAIVPDPVTVTLDPADINPLIVLTLPAVSPEAVPVALVKTAVDGVPIFGSSRIAPSIVGPVSTTNFVPVPVWEPIEVALPTDVITPVRLAFVVAVIVPPPVADKDEAAPITSACPVDTPLVTEAKGADVVPLVAAVILPLLSTVMLAVVYDPAVTAVLANVVEKLPVPVPVTSPVRVIV